MAIPHAQAGHPIDIAPLGPRLSDQPTHALFKSAHLEVMRLVLKAGQALPAHKVAGDITIQCLEGRLTVQAGEHTADLQAQELVWLPAGQAHAVTAHEPSSALVTVALRT